MSSRFRRVNMSTRPRWNGGWDVNFGLNAEPGGANIALALEEETAVTFLFDHKTGWVTDSVNTAVAKPPLVTSKPRLAVLKMNHQLV